jgi:hypothetical protein
MAEMRENVQAFAEIAESRWLTASSSKKALDRFQKTDKNI